MSQTLEALYRQKGEALDYTPSTAITGGQMVQLPDGRAAFATNDIEADVKGAVRVCGVVRVLKTVGIALLAGGDAFWDVSANKAHFRPENSTVDFLAGMVLEDALAADTEVDIVLNERCHHIIDLEHRDAGQDVDGWTTEATNGLGVTADVLAQRFTLSFDAVAEAAQAALFSNRKVPLSAKPIMESRIALYNIGAAAALDINVGLASASHATDFEAVPVFATVQLDGNALAINTHSDDGTTDRAPADSTILAVAATFLEVWIDCRDDTNVTFYVDGVLVDTAASKRILTEALATSVFPIAHIEKTNDATVADVRVTRMRVRTQAV